MGDAILAVEKPKAVERKATAGKVAGRGRPKIASENFSQAIPDNKRATTIAAKAVGMSRPTFERAKAVVETRRTPAPAQSPLTASGGTATC